LAAASYIAAPSLRSDPAGHFTVITRYHHLCVTSDFAEHGWAAALQVEDAGAARNNNKNNYGNGGGGGNRNNKLDVSALGLVSPLGGTGLSSLGALHQTVGVGGLGGLQQTQLGSLLGGGTATTGGVSNELAGLCALLGGSQSHDVTLNAMQVLQVQQAMAAQAAA
jgi:hypothetical protein